MAILNGTGRPDILLGTASADVLRGFGGIDELRGRLGDDILYGHDGVDRLSGDAGNDFLYAGVGDDALDGGEGLDTLFGGLGADSLRGGAGADILQGTTDTGDRDFAADTLWGGDGDDQLLGVDSSSDRLFGGDGNDLVELDNDDAFGEAGDDFLAALFADGRMTGGTGADRFRIRTAEGGEEANVVTDFTAEDTLDLEYTSASAQVRLEGTDLFARLDADNDGLLTDGDGFAEQPEGVLTGVEAIGGDLLIWLGEDNVALEGVVSVAADDWA